MSKLLTPLDSSANKIDRLDDLDRFAKNHPFWSNRLFLACLRGELTRQDFIYIFSQYYLYSKNFTRYVAGVMANCDRDQFRAKLTQNLWEESGEEGGLSHAEIFRNFLKNSLLIQDLSKIEYEDFTQEFVDIYLKNSIQADPVSGSAWLSLGTEGIVSDMYQLLVKGMLQAGFQDNELEFFQIHIGCDDEHAATLTEMMCSYRDLPEWFETCLHAIDRALTARAHFFECLYDRIVRGYNLSLVSTIKDRESLAHQVVDISALKSSTLQAGIKIYSNSAPHRNIEFAVERLSFPVTQVLDPRIVSIPAGKNNEQHRHAHEALLYILQGSGQVLIDHRLVEVATGDVVFIPRWCIHQSQNTGELEMKILAITDFGLTSTVLGNYDRQTRMNGRSISAQSTSN
jgi:pyrroloquinoline quinone (PQQ) biosynthesis protein C/mannose-6-phosphate isomerase-like protein (cupin superfamily)